MNLLIKKNGTNLLVLTLKELGDPAAGSNYLVRFTNEQNQEVTIWKTAATFSNNRYDLLVLNEPADVDFKISGDYMYEVFQMSDPEDEDPNNGVFVEIGKIEFNEKPLETIAPSFEKTVEIYEPGS